MFIYGEERGGREKTGDEESLGEGPQGRDQREIVKRHLSGAGAAWAGGRRQRGSRGSLDGWVMVPLRWRTDWDGPEPS